MTDIARRARWPWAALGAFVSFAIVGLILVVVNGESIAEQVPYVIAFTLFGVVGALLLSRLRGNRIGGLLLFGAAITCASFAGAELATYLASVGISDGPAVVAAALVSTVGWLLGIFPVLLFLPLLFPDGHLPSRRWAPFASPALGAIGWRAAAWLAGVAMAIISVGSLAYGDHESALDATWAWLALGWAVAFVGIAQVATRREEAMVR